MRMEDEDLVHLDGDHFLPDDIFLLEENSVLSNGEVHAVKELPTELAPHPLTRLEDENTSTCGRRRYDQSTGRRNKSFFSMERIFASPKEEAYCFFQKTTVRSAKGGLDMEGAPLNTTVLTPTPSTAS